jgi:hypothetical protein
MYERVGYGMYVVTLKGSGESIGTCGLIKRDELEDVDIGFAFLPQYRGRGFAFESTRRRFPSTPIRPWAGWARARRPETARKGARTPWHARARVRPTSDEAGPG